MSYMLPHLFNGWQVDQAILSEEDKVVIIRFGHDWVFCFVLCLLLLLLSFSIEINSENNPKRTPRA